MLLEKILGRERKRMTEDFQGQELLLRFWLTYPYRQIECTGSDGSCYAVFNQL